MELYLDGQVQPLPENIGRTLGDLLRVLRNALGESDRAITTVKLDGNELLPAEEDEALKCEAADFDQIEIVSAPAAEWGRHGLGEAASALGQLADEFRKIADVLRGGDRAEAINRFQAAVAAYGQLIAALINAASLAEVSAPEGFETAVQTVTASMKDVAPELQAEDSIAAADLAEYELAEHLEELGEMVKNMAGL